MINSEKIRDNFPSLDRLDKKNNQIIYLDGPGGTQVPIQVIEGVSQYYVRSNANTHGEFSTSKETDFMMDGLRERVSDLFGSEGSSTISIGQNMTTLNYSLARALSRKFKEGDEVIITELDHEANRGPWKVLEEVGVKLIEVELLETGVLDYVDFENKINDKTVMVCMGMSSNALGTLNDFIKVGKYLENKNCLFLLDAVHYAPHFSINVQELGCDFMLCSAYKFYGPHVSFLYSRPGLLESLSTDRLIVQDQAAPYIIETGTLNHAACSGVASAIDFISSIGKGASLREKLESAYQKISSHEFELAKHLYDSLKNLEKITVVGPDFSSKKRTPTVSFVHSSFSAQEVCKKLANKNICAWDGHFYALKAIQKLGLESKGGVTRLGISLYNTKQEIDRVIEVIKTI
jgi:cysteine desulfurase family protein (TIGR01976 family)